MGLFTKSTNDSPKKHWSDVIKNRPSDGEFLIERYELEDFNTNSPLIVMPGEEAILIKDGDVELVSEKGKTKLETENYPFISGLRNMFTGGVSAFNCVVYFVKKAHSKEIRWGTTSPLQVEDPKYNEYIKIKAHGACKIQIDNSVKFLEKMAGNVDGILQDELIVKYFSNEMQQYIRSSFKRAIQSTGRDTIDVIGEPDVLAKSISPIIQEIFDDYGIKLAKENGFFIGGIHIDEEDPGFLHIMEMKRDENRMNRFGVDYRTQKGIEIMTNVSNNPGAGGMAAAGAGIGMGMAAGGAFGNMSQQVFNPAQPQQQQAPAQTPPAAEPAKENPVEKIKQLKELLDIGALTQEEFDAKKQDILSRM